MPINKEKSTIGWVYDRARKVWRSIGGNFLAQRETSRRWSLWRLRPGEDPAQMTSYTKETDYVHGGFWFICEEWVCQQCGAPTTNPEIGIELCTAGHRLPRPAGGRWTRTRWDLNHSVTANLFDPQTAAAARLESARSILIEWINQQGHDRCWYYPDVFDQLCLLLGVKKPERPVLPPRPEFEEGCRRYQLAQYEPENAGRSSEEWAAIPAGSASKYDQEARLFAPKGKQWPRLRLTVSKCYDGLTGYAVKLAMRESLLHDETPHSFFVAESAADSKILTACSSLPASIPGEVASLITLIAERTSA